MFHLLKLCTLESTHALEHLIPVNKCSVELRTVDADELGLSTNCKTTSTAHTSTVNHDSIETDICRDSVFLCHKA